MIYDVVILTEKQYINPTIGGKDWYLQQVIEEDSLVLNALVKKGLRVTKKDWADPTFDWSTAKTLLFRTTWDYFNRFDEFEPWLNKVSKITTLINPAAQILWNIDKHYLRDLKEKGIPIVESYFIAKETTQTLAELHRKLDWNETVLKPTVSGAARHTYRLSQDDYDHYKDLFASLIQNEAFMLQPFQKNILTKGEISLVVIAGKYSHAVLKKAKKGDYRVQDDFGGRVHDYQPNEAEILFAEKATKACTPLPLYARVDMIWDNNDELVLSELELIEPELWFRKNNLAADKLATAIYKTYF